MPVAYDQSVDLGFSAKVEGAGEISALADKIDELGKGAGAAQPQFVELSAQLRELGKSDAAINAFREARLESQRLTGGLNEASAAVDRLASELAQAKQQTQAAAVAQSEAASALAQARQRQDDLRVSVMSASNSLAALKDRARESGQYAEIYAGQIAVARARLDELKDAHSLAKAEVNALAVDQRAAAAAVKELSGAEKDLQKDYERSVRWAGDLSGALKSQNTNLDVARESLKALGIDSTKLSETQSRLTADIARTKQAVAELGDRFKATASESNTVNAALAKLGIRSARQIEADILEINQALQQLAQRSGVSAQEFQRAFEAGQQKIAALRNELSGLPADQAAKGFSLADTALAGLKATAASFVGVGLGQKFIEANLAADKLQKSLNAVNGDAGKTASDLAFLKETAQRLGINLESSSAAFVKLAASAKGTSLEGQATRDIFTNLGSAMSRLGLSSAETERAFTAIGQMMGKGTVAAEELKGQLGDVLPGAMQIAARATGLTTAELGKLMESGGLLAEDFLPKFAAEAAKSFGGVGGEVNGLSNNIERAKNAWSQAFKIFGDTGALASLGMVMGLVNEALLLAATGATTVASAFFAFIKAGAVLTAAVANWDFSKVGEELSAIGNEALGNVEKMARLTSTAKLTGEMLQGTGEAAKAAGAAADTGKAGWERLIAAYAKAQKDVEDNLALTKKTVTANNDQAETLSKIADLSEDVRAKMLAKEEVTRVAADGAEKLAQALKREAEVTQAKLTALELEVAGQKVVSDEKRKAIDAAKQAAEAKAEEARAADAAAKTSRVAAAAAEVEAAAWYDNSGRVKELKAAYEAAALKVDVLKVAQAAGKDVTTELAAAQTAAARAHALLTDALRDQIDKINQNLMIKQSQINVDQAGIRLSIEKQRTIYENARALGDEHGATQALLEIKKLEIKLAELTAQAKKAEAEAALLAVKAKREELEATNGLTPAKEAELKAQEAAAKVKQIEGEIASETARRMRDLTETNQQLAGSHHAIASSSGGAANGIAGVGAAAAGARGPVDSYTSSLERMAAAQAAADRRGVLGADGVYRNAAGQHVENEDGKPIKDKNGNALTDTTSILDHKEMVGRKGTVDLTQWLFKASDSMEEVKAAQKYIGELYEREKATKLTGNVGDSTNYTRLNKLAIDEAVQKALAAARIELATGKQVDLGFSMQDMLSKEMARVDWSNQLTNEGGIKTMMDAVKRAGSQAENQTAAVTINIGGKSQKVDLASVADRDALTGILRQLEDDGRRAY